MGMICERKGLTVPSFVADVEHGGGKGWCAGALGDGGVVEVAQLGLALALWVAHVLAEHHVRSGNGGDALQHLHLAVHRNIVSNTIFSQCESVCVGGRGTEMKERMNDSNDLFVPHVIRVRRGWFLHGHQAEHLQQMVLHDVPTSGGWGGGCGPSSEQYIPDQAPGPHAAS